MPWKNGGGVTREIHAHPDPSAFDWRLSIADVNSDGPFSTFSGHARTIVLLEGDGMLLTVGAAAPVPLTERFGPFDFDGAAATRCELVNGPVRDLNVMSVRERVRHAWQLVRTFPVTPRIERDAMSLALFCLHGECRAALDDGTLVPLERHGTLLMERPGRLCRLLGDGDAAAFIVQFLPAS